MTPSPSTTTPLEAPEAISKGWDLFTKNWKTILPIHFVAALPGMVNSGLQNAAQDSSLMSAAVGTAANLTAMYLGYGVYKSYLALHDGQPAGINTLGQPINPAARQILGSIAYGFAVGIGLVFLIIPGIYISLKYMFVPYILADKEVGIREAFSLSSKITQGRMMSAFGYMLLSILVMFGGILALLVGIIPAIIAITFGYTALYRSWSKAAGV